MATHVTTKLVKALLLWFAINARDLPWRRTRDPYGIWVSEIMLQQTQVKTVIPYWERWMKQLSTIESLASAPLTKIHKLWEGLGYYTRVRNMQKAAQEVVAGHDGKFPTTFEEVLALPGIGRYTAGAICSIAFNQPQPILDGNVIRVLTRIFGITTDPREKKTNAQLWELAEQLVKQSEAQHACSALNQSLMELGALICTPRAPKCEVCPVESMCLARKLDLVEKLPALKKREPATARHFVAFIAKRKGRFLVRQRPNGVVNGHLWEFPNVEVDAASPRSSWSMAGFRSKSSAPLCTIKHSITRYRITLHAFAAEVSSHRSKPDGQWLAHKELQGLAFSSAHKRILAHLEE